jgi:Zn-finger nucleic acid-binding protein
MLVERHDETEVDRCPFCSGLWFDASELDRILQASQGGVFVEPAIPKRGMSAMSCPPLRAGRVSPSLRHDP